MSVYKTTLLCFFLAMGMTISSCSKEEEWPEMAEELFFSLNLEGKSYSYHYPLPPNYLDNDGEGFIEVIPDDLFNNFFVYSNRSQILMIDVATNCQLKPGTNSCIFLALSLGNALGNHSEVFIYSFALDDYFINTLRVNDPDAKVNLEVNIRRYHPEKMLMEGDFGGMVFTEYPSNMIPETAKRAMISGNFRVGVLGNPDLLENHIHNKELRIKGEER